MTASVLAYPCFGDGVEFILEIDASISGLVAVLSYKQQDQCLHSLAYASRKIQVAAKITALQSLRP